MSIFRTLLISNILLANFLLAQKMPVFNVTVCDPSSTGYFFFSPIRLGMNGNNSLPMLMMLDNTGGIVYYKHLTKGPFGGLFKINPDNTMSFYFDKKFFIMSSDFKVIDSVTCKNGLEVDGHEFLVLPNGHYVMIGNEVVTMDLSSYPYFKKNGSPGSKRARVTCNVVQELDQDKNVVFEWHGKDHFQFSDVDPTYMSDSVNVDWMHFNAIDYDRDGNVLISSKFMNEITKVNRKTGEIMWRLGGKKNQFKFVNDDLVFLGQHDVRQTAAGTITVFDNGRPGFPFHPEMAKEYRIDEKKMTAELIWSHINDPNLCSTGFGKVQRMPNGNTLINYGRDEKSRTIFNVVSPEKKKIFEVVSTDSVTSYRTYYYEKLPWKPERPGIRSFKKDGHLYLEATTSSTAYIWSTGEKTKTIRAGKKGNYTLSIPFGDGGFLVSQPYAVKEDQ